MNTLLTSIFLIANIHFCVGNENERNIVLDEETVGLGFDAVSHEAEVVFDLRLTDETDNELNIVTKFLDYSCDENSDVNVLNLSGQNAIDDNGVATLRTRIDLNNLNGNSLYNSVGEEATIKYCLKAWLGADTSEFDYTALPDLKLITTISYDPSRFGETATIEISNENNPETFTGYDDLDFHLSACICDADGECDQTPQHQNSIVKFCIHTTSDWLVIAGVKNFSLVQPENSFTFTPIKDGTPTNSLSRLSGMGTKEESISTYLISAFFDNPSDISVFGEIQMGFASEAVEQRRHLSTDGYGSTIDAGVNFKIVLSDENVNDVTQS